MGSTLDASHTKTSYESLYSISTEKSSAFEIKPNAGYFVVDRLALGLKMPIGYSKTTTYSQVVKANSINGRYLPPLASS